MYQRDGITWASEAEYWEATTVGRITDLIPAIAAGELNLAGAIARAEELLDAVPEAFILEVLLDLKFALALGAL